MTQSILGRVRHEAFADGYSQGATVGHDVAYEAGRRDALAQASQDSYRWGWFCFLCGVGVTAILAAFA